MYQLRLGLALTIQRAEDEGILPSSWNKLERGRPARVEGRMPSFPGGRARRTRRPGSKCGVQLQRHGTPLARVAQGRADTAEVLAAVVQ